MKTYFYPQNLKATANLWLWSLRDFAILCIGLLFSFAALTQLGLLLPLALSAAWAFLTIRPSDLTVLDYQDKQAARNVYDERPIERVPLSQNPDFKPVRNAVVRAATELEKEQLQAQHPAYTPPLLPMATRLLRQVGQIFGNQFQIDQPVARLTDSKLRQKIAEKKLALGQKFSM